MEMKKAFAISIPITILIILIWLIADLPDVIGGLLLLALIVELIFWKFVKHL